MSSKIVAYKKILAQTLLISLCLSCNPGEANNKNDSAKEETLTSPKGYDLTKPIEIKLPLELDEISGVAYHPEDTSVFAIQDENGLLYKIPLNNPQNIEKWEYRKGADYEDVVLKGDRFYVLQSNGNITAVKFYKADSLAEKTTKFPFGKGNEFEILYYDSSVQKLRMICKDCEEDKKKHLSSYFFDPVNFEYAEDSVKIDVKSIDNLMGKKKIKFKPSAAAIHPITHELYIISSINKLLVVVDNNTGIAKQVHSIDKNLFKQPEGITFTPGGTMIISNESAKIGVANLLIFPYKTSMSATNLNDTSR